MARRIIENFAEFHALMGIVVVLAQGRVFAGTSFREERIELGG